MLSDGGLLGSKRLQNTPRLVFTCIGQYLEQTQIVDASLCCCRCCSSGHVHNDILDILPVLCWPEERQPT